MLNDGVPGNLERDQELIGVNDFRAIRKFLTEPMTAINTKSSNVPGSDDVRGLVCIAGPAMQHREVVRRLVEAADPEGLRFVCVENEVQLAVHLLLEEPHPEGVVRLYDRTNLKRWCIVRNE